MTCDDAEQLIDDQLDGLLTSGQEAELLAHLSGCAACSRVRRDLEVLGEAMRRLEDAPLADGTWDRLVRRAMAEHPSAPVRTRWFPVAAGSVATAAALLFAMWWIGEEQGRHPDRVAQHPLAGSSVSAIASVWPPSRAKTPETDGGPAAPADEAETEIARRPTSRPHRSTGPSGPAPPTGALAPSEPGPAQLTAPDVMYIYETALAFARIEGSGGVPPDPVVTARMHASTGAVGQAVRDYEQAVATSMGPPTPPNGLFLDESDQAALAETPQPPVELMAEVPVSIVELNGAILAYVSGGE